MIVGFCGNLQRPSKSRLLVEVVAAKIASKYPQEVRIIDIVDIFPELCETIGPVLPKRVAEAVKAIQESNALVVGTPVYKGSYTGLFKHFFDLIDPGTLAGLPLIITATGGGDRHALVVEHQLRPLFAFFTAHAAPTAIYASAKDFTETGLSENVTDRIERAVSDLAPLLTSHRFSRIS